MPYIKRESRPVDEHVLSLPECAGDLNYLISRAVSIYIGSKGLCYQTLNDVMGVLRGVGVEVERRLIAPYEEIKCEQNGEVFDEALRALHEKLKG